MNINRREEQEDRAAAGNIKKRGEQESIAAAGNIKRGTRSQSSSREYREERNIYFFFV